MLTDPALRSQLDVLWNKLWSGGLPNPLDSIEQISYLLFMKSLDDAEQDRERAAKRRKQPYESLFPEPELRWSHWTNLPAAEALKFVKEKAFPFIKQLGGERGSFAAQMANAEFKIPKPSLLIEACRLIDQLDVSGQNQDVQGDLYEYLLSHLTIAGKGGQFRTPRHIIRMMVKMADPRPEDKICDPAAGTCGFLVNAYQHLLETHTSPEILTYDEEGFPHNTVGDKLTRDQHQFLQEEALTGFDNDAGMTMLRIGSMNLMLHGIDRPRFHHTDTLGKEFTEERGYDVILANPPFKGAIDADDVSASLPAGCKKTEILFLHLFLRLLDMGGRAAVIVPDGVLFGSSRAHVAIREKLIEENRLEAVVSMPSGVFKPYAGVSTAVLVFTRGADTEKIWFYQMGHDGFSLDDKRQKTPDRNDIPDLLDCWQHRHDSKFAKRRAVRLAELEAEVIPMKERRQELRADIHRLTFEEVIASEEQRVAAHEALDAAKETLAECEDEIRPLQAEIDQIQRQFWVEKAEVVRNKYDLSASRYRELEEDEGFYENATVTLSRLEELTEHGQCETEKLRALLS